MTNSMFSAVSPDALTQVAGGASAPSELELLDKSMRLCDASGDNKSDACKRFGRLVRHRWDRQWVLNQPDPASQTAP